MRQSRSFCKKPHSNASVALSVAICMSSILPLTAMSAAANTSMTMLSGSMNAWTHPALHNQHTTSGAFASQHAAGNAALRQADSKSLVHSPVKSLFHFAKSTNQAQLENTANTAFNLSSSQLHFLAGNLGNFPSLTIDVGGKTEVVGLNTKLSAAEYVAAEQILATGSQSIVLASNGSAGGGSLVLNTKMLSAIDGAVGSSISSLTIARGLTVVDSLSQLNIGKSLVNMGNIEVASSKIGATDVISASSVSNAQGAAINSYSGNQLAGADISLVANSLSNSGTINSVQNLSVSSPSTLSVSGNGIMQAGNNINFASGTDSNCNIVKDLASGNNIFVTGANLYSQQVNLNAGTGNINASLGQVTGAVNTSGNAVAFTANSQNLIIGAINAKADPLFASPGNIIIGTGKGGTNITATGGAPLTIVAGGNITSDPTITSLSTANGSGNGGDLVIIAGAAFKVSGTGAKQVLTVTGASTTGGSIDLTAGGTTATSITTAGTGPTGNGGSIVLAAYANSSGALGSVTTDSKASITTASLGGSGGSLTAIAGATAGSGVDIRSAISTNGLVNGGNVSIATATPTGKVTFNDDLTSPLFGAATGALKAGALQNSSITLDAVTTGGGSLAASSGSSIVLGVNQGATSTNGSAAAVAGQGGAKAGNITLSGTDITMSGDVTSIGANGADGKSSGQAGGAGGQGGNITIDSTGTLTVDGILVTVGGNGGTGFAGVSSSTAAGAGGGGGNGGLGGKLAVQSQTMDVTGTFTGATTYAAGSVESVGGNGGAAGGGGTATGATKAIAGGAGGAGGNGGTSGTIVINTGTLTDAAGSLATLGGTGGSGAKGGDGSGMGANGGIGGNSGNTGIGGSLAITSTASGIGAITFSSPTSVIAASAGLVMSAGSGGNGADSATGNGGKGGAAGAGGNGTSSGALSIVAKNGGSITIASQFVFDRAGVADGGFSVNGGKGGSATGTKGNGGAGGAGAFAGKGANAGNITIEADGGGSITLGQPSTGTTSTAIYVLGGASVAGGSGGAGGNATAVGGTGKGGAGGAGGSIGVSGSQWYCELYHDCR